MDFDIKQAKKTFSHIGWALCIILLSATVLQALWLFIPRLFWGEDNWAATSSWGMWVGSFAPLYLVAVPLGISFLKTVPGEAPCGQKLGVGKLLVYLLMAFPLMYGGNLLGIGLSALLSGGTAENGLDKLAMDTNPLKILVMVILAPLIEEYIFRKQVIDRVGKFGEKTAVLFSGLLFGLFHQNLFQFFYAFFLGCLFGYIYIRTGRLRYTVILHGIVNFLGAVVAPWILSLVDQEALLNLDTTAEELLAQSGGLMPGLAVYLLYALTLITLSFIGLVVLIVKLTRLSWRQTEQAIPSGMRFRAAYLNGGVLALVLLCLAGCVLSLL